MTVSRIAQVLGAMTLFTFSASSCSGSNTDTAPPDQATSSPSYYAQGVPYLHERTLYIDHKAQPGQWVLQESAGDYIVALATDQSGSILRDGVEVQRISGPVYTLRLSPNGTKAAWVESSGPGAGTLVIRDLVRSRDLGRTPVLLGSRGAQGISVAVQLSDSGKVLYEVNDKYWSWMPGTGLPTRADPPSDGGIAGPRMSDVNRPRPLSPDHLWVAWMPRSAGALSVQKPGDPSSRFTIPMPHGSGRNGLVQWESPTVALVLTNQATEDGRQQIIACDITTRRCKDATDTYSPR